MHKKKSTSIGCTLLPAWAETPALRHPSAVPLTPLQSGIVQVPGIRLNQGPMSWVPPLVLCFFTANQPPSHAAVDPGPRPLSTSGPITLPYTSASIPLPHTSHHTSLPSPAAIPHHDFAPSTTSLTICSHCASRRTTSATIQPA